MAEQETFISKSLQKTLKGNVQKSLTALKEEQKAVEQQIKELIQADARLKELFDLIARRRNQKHSQRFVFCIVVDL